MIGINACTHTNHLITGGLLINYFTYQRNVRTITQTQAWDVRKNVNFHIQHSNDYITLINIKLTLVKCITKRKRIARNPSCAPSFISNLN